MWGIKRGRLTIIGARTSQGKSAFAIQIANDLASQGHGTLFLSLEMDSEDCVERIFCNEAEVSNVALLHGEINKYRDKYIEFSRNIEGRPLVFSDCIGWDWREITEFIEHLEVKPKVIIVDYIQAISRQGMEQREAIDEYIRRLRELAIRQNIAVILVSQINRLSQDSKDKEPHLHHLKGSGYLEEHADVVILLHWPYKYNNETDINKYKIIIEKNRNGVTGVIKARFIPEFYRFEDEQTTNYPEVVKELNKDMPRKDWHG